MMNWLKLWVGPPVGAAVLRLLGRTVRVRIEGEQVMTRLYEQGHHMIFAFWHAQQLMMPFAYRGQGAHVLISQHRDGEIIQQIAVRFGFHAVRGSSTRGGPSALRELIRLGRAGQDLVVTPDGPKGPRQIAKLGAVQLASATGLPIVPVSFGCSKKKSSPVGTASSCPIPSLAGSSA